MGFLNLLALLHMLMQRESKILAVEGGFTGIA